MRVACGEVWKCVVLSLSVVVFHVHAKPLPEGTVTQTGEPSHFQVDDKAAEIEVNANPAGVKVNAKPASLQVVARPAAPELPVFHPAVELAAHYGTPPLIRREPALSYAGPTWPSYGGYFAGLRRNTLAKPNAAKIPAPVAQKKAYLTPASQTILNAKRSRILRTRAPYKAKTNEDMNIRSYRGRIPKNHKHPNTHKRQFIQGLPQGYHQQSLGSLGGFDLAPQFGVLSPFNPLTARSRMSTRAPLARSTLMPGYGQGPGTGGIGGMGSYGMPGSSALSALAASIGINPISAYSNPLPNTYAGVGGYGQNPSSAGFDSLSQGHGAMSSLYSDALGGQSFPGLSSAPNPLAPSNAYSRSLVSNPYASLSAYPSNFGSYRSSLMNGLSSTSAGNLYSGLFGLNPLLMGYRRPPTRAMLADMYAAQAPMTSLGGLQGIVTQGNTPFMGLPYGTSRLPFLKKKSSVPGSRGSKIKNKPPKAKPNPVKGSKVNKRRKRQLLLPDDGGLDLGALQDDLINQYKRQLILGRSLQSAATSPLAGIADPGALQLPQLQGLDQALMNQQSTNPILQKLDLAALNANYISPIDNINSRLSSSQLPLAQPRLPIGQAPLMTSPLVSRLPFASPRLPVSSSPLTRGMLGRRAFDASVNPMIYGGDYRSPLVQERPHFRRRHPLFRRRLNRFRDYDDEDEEGDEEEPEVIRAEPYGRERVSIEGSYSDKLIPNDRGETLVDSDNLGFGPITVEAKTAEGVRKSLGHESRSSISKPIKKEERKMRDRHIIPRAPTQDILVQR